VDRVSTNKLNERKQNDYIHNARPKQNRSNSRGGSSDGSINRETERAVGTTPTSTPNDTKRHGSSIYPMDTSPQAQELSNLFVNLTSTMQAIIKLCVETQTKEQPSKELNETVDTVLSEADWLKEMVDKRVEDLVDDKDFAYEINSEVEDWFSNSFSLDDHVDITAEVESKVEDIAEDLLKDIVEERLAEIVSDKLQNLRITFD